MSPRPTGRLTRLDDEFELIITRTIAAPIEDVWDSLTDPARTALWFGTWRGEPGEGRTIEVQMGFEEGSAWFSARIDECTVPALLRLTTLDPSGSMRLTVRLTSDTRTTLVELVHHLDEPTLAQAYGPGWEYYLDMLIASRDGSPLPSFEEYDPAQVDYFAALVRAILD